MYTSSHQTTGQNHYKEIANKPFENVAGNNVNKSVFAFARNLRAE
jgi:hypothetical protein